MDYYEDPMTPEEENELEDRINKSRHGAGELRLISEALARKSFDLSNLYGKCNTTKEFEDRLMLRVELLKDISEALGSLRA